MKVGDLKKREKFMYKGELFRVVGLDSTKSYNNVLCKSLDTDNYAWFDLETPIDLKVSDQK